MHRLGVFRKTSSSSCSTYHFVPSFGYIYMESEGNEIKRILPRLFRPGFSNYPIITMELDPGAVDIHIESSCSSSSESGTESDEDDDSSDDFDFETAVSSTGKLDSLSPSPCKKSNSKSRSRQRTIRLRTWKKGQKAKHRSSYYYHTNFIIEKAETKDRYPYQDERMGAILQETLASIRRRLGDNSLTEIQIMKIGLPELMKRKKQKDKKAAEAEAGKKQQLVMEQTKVDNDEKKATKKKEDKAEADKKQKAKEEAETEKMNKDEELHNQTTVNAIGVCDQCGYCFHPVLIDNTKIRRFTFL